MTFDKWFEKQSLLVRIILLVIPFVGWVMEVLCRISAVIRNSSTTNIVGLVLGAVIPFWGWVDIVGLLLNDKFFLFE